MEIVAALFIENLDVRPVPGPSTRIDLTGIMFSLPAPQPPPVTLTPHLIVLARCPAAHGGQGTLETSFRDGTGNEVAGHVRAMLHRVTLLGCTAESIVGGAREVEQQPAISLWAGHTGPVTPLHLQMERTPDGDALVGWADIGDSAGLLLLADPFTFPA